METIKLLLLRRDGAITLRMMTFSITTISKMTHNIIKLSVRAIGMTTFSITTINIMPVRKLYVSITTLTITPKNVSRSINYNQLINTEHNNKKIYTQHK